MVGISNKISPLQAEADERAGQLADQTARADAAETAAADLTATMAARDTAIMTLQQVHAQQVCPADLVFLLEPGSIAAPCTLPKPHSCVRKTRVTLVCNWHQWEHAERWQSIAILMVT